MKTKEGGKVKAGKRTKSTRKKGTQKTRDNVKRATSREKKGKAA